MVQTCFDLGNLEMHYEPCWLGFPDTKKRKESNSWTDLWRERASTWRENSRVCVSALHKSHFLKSSRELLIEYRVLLGSGQKIRAKIKVASFCWSCVVYDESVRYLSILRRRTWVP